MAPARTYHCSSCGGVVHENARTCEFCRAPVATVRCAACFHMNPSENSYCSGCGGALGLQPLEQQSQLRCPKCNATLASFQLGTHSLFDCGGCGGQFVQHQTLRELLARPEAIGQATPAAHATVHNPLSDRVVYLKCPVCREFMNRKNFGNVSGIIVDVCGGHGVWFDAAELPRVLQFVQSGGAQKIQRYEAEQRQKQRSARLTTPAPAYDSNGPSELEYWTAALDTLVEIVSSVLRRR